VEGGKVTAAVPPKLAGQATGVKVVATTENKNGKAIKREESPLIPWSDAKNGAASVALVEVALPAAVSKPATATIAQHPVMPATTGSDQPFSPGPASPLHLSFLGGLSWLYSLPTNSTSGFYSGNTNNNVGSLIGGAAFYDVYSFGTRGAPFAWYTISVGAVIDFTDSSVQWTGTCGGAECANNGHMVESNYIGEVKVTTPIGGDNTANAYYGWGVAHLGPEGMPTGPGGPSFLGGKTVQAYRVGWGIDHQFDPSLSVGFKGGFQFTDGATFDTTLPGERFHIGHKDEFIGAIVVTYTPALSDIRLKRDIVEVGHLDNGLGLYRYRYLWSDQVYVGVMAQEVAQVVPGAVMMAPDGYLRVDYAKLGTHLQTFEQWVAAGRPHGAI
jgi:hypothetical protein